MDVKKLSFKKNHYLNLHDAVFTYLSFYYFFQNHIYEFYCLDSVNLGTNSFQSFFVWLFTSSNKSNRIFDAIKSIFSKSAQYYYYYYYY